MIKPKLRDYLVWMHLCRDLGDDQTLVERTCGQTHFVFMLITTLTQNENCSRFLMGFTMNEIKTPVPPNAGSEIQSFLGMLNFIS